MTCLGPHTAIKRQRQDCGPSFLWPEFMFSIPEPCGLCTPGEKWDGLLKRQVIYRNLGGSLYFKQCLEFLEERETGPLIWRLVPSLRTWRSPAEHQRVQRILTSDKTAVITMARDKSKASSYLCLKTHKPRTSSKTQE